MQFIDLHRQYEKIEGNLGERLKNIMANTSFIEGPDVKELEKRLAEYVGVKHVITCANGTDGLTIPLMAYGIQSTDAVFVPSFTFFASAESITLAGGTPVFVDVRKDTFNMDPDDLEAKILATIEEGKLRPKGIVAVDLFGMPADFDRIRKLADQYDLFILEDGAQGFGGTLNNKRACSFGDVASTSFFPAKPLGCYGDGGAIFTNDDKLADLIHSIHVHGQGETKYDNVRIGLNSRLDTMQAAVLNEKLSIFDEELVRRNHVAKMYTERLSDYVVTPIVPEQYTSSWAQYTIQLKDRQQRDKVVSEMKEKGIPIMTYYLIPIHKSGAYAGCDARNMKNSEELCDVVCSLPMHPYMEQSEIDLVCDTLKSIL